MHPNNCKLSLIHTGDPGDCVWGQATAEGIQLWAGLALLLWVCPAQMGEVTCGCTPAAGRGAASSRGCAHSAPVAHT